ncbi:retrovirus-related pol polyprotein from transposon TNT 1-94, partial [Tanacetum coccineum]
MSWMMYVVFYSCLIFQNGYFKLGFGILEIDECMDNGDSQVAKEMKLFDALEHKSAMIEEGNQKFSFFTKAPLRSFGDPFMRYSLPCKVDGDYGRKMVNDVNVEIHGVKFKADFVVLDYANEGEPSIMFGRDFLATTKSQVDFGLGKIKMNLTMFEEVNSVVDLLEEIGSSSEVVVKMGKANHNKGYNINKLTLPPSLKLEEIPSTSTIPPQPIYYPLASKQREKMKEVLDIKYKELEESKPILEVLENYVIYKKRLDEILKETIPVKINGVVEMVALVDTGASVSVLPYSLYKDLGLGDPRPYQTNLTMENNTQAKAIGEVKNVRIQIGYQAYVVDLLVLDIPVDPELPLLLGRPFLRTCGAIIDMGRGTLCIDDEVIRHTYFTKPRSKSYVETFEMEGEDDWLGNFEVGRDEDGNAKYGSVAPSSLDIEDDMERALGNEGYETYKNIDGDGNWHARFEILTPSERKFNRTFKNKTTTRKLLGKFTTEDVLRSYDARLIVWITHFDFDKIEKCRKDTLPNRLIIEYEKRNKKNTITYSLQPVSNGNLRWKDLPSAERHTYCERNMMKLEYIYEGDGDVFVDYSWERALSIDDEVYPEWVLELFSTMYFDKDVDKRNLMTEKCLFTEDETKVRKPTLTNHKEVLVKEPLMRIVHKLIVGSLVHRLASRERCQKQDLWMMSALEESRRVNLAWIIADHFYKHASGTKESSVIYAGHYVTKIASSLRYCVDDKIKKCPEPIDCEYWTTKMLAEELDEKNWCLLKDTRIPTQLEIGSKMEQRQDQEMAQTLEEIPQDMQFRDRLEEQDLMMRNGATFGMDTLSLVSEYLKDLEECMDNEDSRVAKEMKLFDALEYKSIVDGQKAWDAELDFANSVNYVTEKVLDSMGFVHVSISDYSRKMVNYFNVEIHGVKFKADFVVLDYANEGEPSIMFGRKFLATTKSQVDFGLGEIKMNLTMFEEVKKLSRWGRQTATKGIILTNSLPF